MRLRTRLIRLGWGSDWVGFAYALAKAVVHNAHKHFATPLVNLLASPADQHVNKTEADSIELDDGS